MENNEFDSIFADLLEVLDDATKKEEAAKKDVRFIELKNDYIKFIKGKELAGFNVHKIFVEYNEQNSIIFDELIGLCNKYVDLFKPVKSFCEYKSTFELLYDEMHSCAGDLGVDLRTHIEKDNRAYNYKENYMGVALMLHYFMDSGYLLYDNRKIIKNNVVVLPDDLKALKLFRDKSEFGLFEGIITKDGQLCLCLDEHEILVNWLLANGKKVDGALRLNQSASGGADKIATSSLYHFELWCQDVSADKFIKLTDEQAKTLVVFTDTITKNRLTKSDNSLKSVLSCSSNLGYSMFDWVRSGDVSKHFNIPVAKWNMLTIEEASGKLFNSKEMMNEIVENYKLCKLKQDEDDGSLSSKMKEESER